MKRIITVLFLLAILFPFSLYAGTTGKLTGKVTDKKTGEALPFVNVILEGTTIGAATDLDGKYVILNIPPGKYNVRYQYIGYQTVVTERVSISIDLTTTQDAILEETAVELQAIVIQGNVTKIQKDVTSSQARVTSEEISNLPVAELSDVLQMQAGVTKGAGGDFHIRGGRSSEIAYWVNGISITDGFDNSKGIEIDNSSVQELQVISGTFNAEYGQALSGIVNTVTKEGGSKFKSDIKLYGGDHVSNFTDYYAGIDKINPLSNYNAQASLSGPIPGTDNKLTFFINGRYNYDDGYNYGYRNYIPDGKPGDSSLVSMDWSKRFIGQSNISWFASQNLKFNFELLYSREEFKNYNHGFKWNPDGDVTKYTNSYNATFTLTHTLSTKSFYTLKVSRFFKDFNEHLYDSPDDPRYLHPDSLNTISYAFLTKGTNLHRFFRETNTTIGKIDFTSQVSESHLLKIGVEARIHDLSFDDYNLEPKRENNIEVTPFAPSIPAVNTPNRTMYSSKPLEFSAYIQDKIELESVIINIGFRLDYFDSRGNILADPTDPNIYLPLRSPSEFGLTLPNDAWTPEAIKEASNRESGFYKKASSKLSFGPRFGIAYPISDQGVLHFSYGNFLQVPTFQYLFNRGEYYVPNTGSGYGPYGNPNLEPQTTTMYEIGFKQELLEALTVDLTGFYRDIRNWITAGPLIQTRNLVTYSTYINKDYSNVKGITLSLSKRFSDNYSIDLNYTYQVAEGSNSSPEDEFYSQLGNNEPTLYLIPLDWDQRHLLNLSMYVGDKTWGVSAVARYGTGLPYTPSITQYTADRGITSGLQRNIRQRPPQFSIDLNIHKSFTVFGLEITSFLRIFNLLDSKVIVNVFGDTGKADYTTQGKNIGADPNRPNTVSEYLKYPWNYGEPRKIDLGFEFSF